MGHQRKEAFWWWLVVVLDLVWPLLRVPPCSLPSGIPKEIARVLYFNTINGALKLLGPWPAGLGNRIGNIGRVRCARVTASTSRSQVHRQDVSILIMHRLACHLVSAGRLFRGCRVRTATGGRCPLRVVDCVEPDSPVVQRVRARCVYPPPPHCPPSSSVQRSYLLRHLLSGFLMWHMSFGLERAVLMTPTGRTAVSKRGLFAHGDMATSWHGKRLVGSCTWLSIQRRLV